MRIWRHLDLILTAAAAVVIGGMGMLDLASIEITGGATLATLGVLTAATLTARLQTHRLHEAATALAAYTSDHANGTPPAERLLTPARPGADADLRDARDVGIIGVTLARTLRHHLTELTACLRRGGTVRIAVVDAASGAVAEAARRSCVPQSPEIFVHRLRSTADLLRELSTASGQGNLEIRLLDFVPAAGLLMVDPQRDHGQVWVDVYSHRFATAEPTFVLRAVRDRVWYPHFRQEFEQVWSAGHDLTVPVEVR